VLLSLVGRDLADFTAVLRHSGLDRTLVRLSGSLEENGLYAVGGDESGTMFAAMQSFASLGDENRLGLDERHRALFGETAPVLDAYAEGVYDGVHLVASLAAEGLLRPDLAPSDVLRLTRGAGRGRTTHLARADGTDFTVVSTA